MTSRRFMLQASSLLPLGLMSTMASAKPLNTSELLKLPRLTVDVIVVGTGFAGLTAALAAAEKGSSVALIDKMPLVGGNSSLSGGMMAVPGSSIQKAQGIADTPENLVKDMERIGKGLGDHAHVEQLCKNAANTFEWTIKHGVKWNPHLTGKGGHSKERCLITEQGSGAGILKPFLADLAKLGVKPKTRTLMTQIIRNDDDRVVGIVVRSNYQLGKPDSGTLEVILARKGVILATGGFGADVTYRSKLDPNLGDKFQTTNQIGATSEGIRAASRIGAHLIQTDWIQCLPSCSPKESGIGLGTHFASISGSLFGIWVNSKTGQRFVNEFGDRKVGTDAILKVINGGGTALAISDQNGVDHLEVLRPGLLNKALEKGAVLKFPTLEALAKHYDIDYKALEQSVERYNELLKAGTDKDFGRRFDKKAQPLGKAPWYVSEMSPKVHHCMGGVETALNTAVIDVDTLKPIDGLYAAGECVGGIHGAVRVGACAVLDCLVNGKLAGETVAKAKPIDPNKAL